MARREETEQEAGVSPPAPRPTPVIGVGMVGYAFMGAAHSQGWRTAGHVFDLPVRPALAAICGRDRTRSRRGRPPRVGAAETDWRALIARDDVDLVDICTPGDSHAEIAVAALEAGKHVLCEKPLANTVAEAEAMARQPNARRPGGRWRSRASTTVRCPPSPTPVR